MTYPDGLTPLEQRCLADCLENGNDSAVRAGFASQLAAVRAGGLERTGAGFFRSFVAAEEMTGVARLPDGMYDIAFATHPELPGGAMFLLNVENGLLSYLEAVTMSGDWPTDEEAFEFH